MRYLLILFLWLPGSAFAQQGKHYADSIRSFQQDYVISHEVVKGADKKYLRFYPVNASFHVTAVFEKISDSLQLKTSKGGSETFYRYGKITLRLNNKVYAMYIYQSPRLMHTTGFEDYLFLPFTDLSNGRDTYGGGRYIDLTIKDIQNDKLVIDFNKCYNPYCAYRTGYRCPIPPKENDLPLAVTAGEKAFGKRLINNIPAQK